MQVDEVTTLKSLGTKVTEYKYEEPSEITLETFLNKFPNRDYEVEYIYPEFTSLCPKTGQPDFATIHLWYIPDKWCIETKSLKLYFGSYRNHKSFMETIINNILEHCVLVCKPRKMTVFGKFNPRGGTTIEVTATYEEQK